MVLSGRFAGRVLVLMMLYFGLALAWESDESF